MKENQFLEFLNRTADRVDEFISNSSYIKYFRPQHLHDAVMSYLKRPAKRLRPAVLLLSCGCFGNERKQEIALPAAAGVELFHTWTLVHDDIIDNDSLRRGEQTVHVEFADRGEKELEFKKNVAESYGRSIAILAGDMLHGWSIASFLECSIAGGIKHDVIMKLVRHLQTDVLSNLIFGEVLDVQYGLSETIDKMSISEDKIIEMEWLKTGVLYRFAALSGACIGKNSADFSDPPIKGLSVFAGNCGIAFQLQDDILGVVGDEAMLGKPVGSDIREGKKTTILLESLNNANQDEKQYIMSVMGNTDASRQDVERVISMFKNLNGIDYTHSLAKKYIDLALPHLDVLPNSTDKEILLSWADFMVNRKY